MGERTAIPKKEKKKKRDDKGSSLLKNENQNGEIRSMFSYVNFFCSTVIRDPEYCSATYSVTLVSIKIMEKK